MPHGNEISILIIAKENDKKIWDYGPLVLLAPQNDSLRWTQPLCAKLDCSDLNGMSMDALMEPLGDCSHFISSALLKADIIAHDNRNSRSI
jgi:hypothetical protein